MAKKWLQGAIKHEGLLGKEASASGRPEIKQAEHDSHSSNPSTRGRGLLGIRLIRKKI